MEVVSRFLVLPLEGDEFNEIRGTLANDIEKHLESAESSIQSEKYEAAEANIFAGRQKLNQIRAAEASIPI